MYNIVRNVKKIIDGFITSNYIKVILQTPSQVCALKVNIMDIYTQFT